MAVHQSPKRAFLASPALLRMSIAAVLAVLFAFAPLICVRLCESRSALSAASSGHVAHVGHNHHDRDHDHNRHHAPDASQTDAHHAWLGELQAMLRALVEFALTGGALVILARAVLCDVAGLPGCIRRVISPLPPPPRLSMA